MYICFPFIIKEEIVILRFSLPTGKAVRRQREREREREIERERERERELIFPYLCSITPAMHV